MIKLRQQGSSQCWISVICQTDLIDQLIANNVSGGSTAHRGRMSSSNRRVKERTRSIYDAEDDDRQ